ncbi:MAG TPA: hypothetical protein VG844_11080 [Terracidiphilus sp.]|nr:hypothetical protein [Terracidiphilus sp.]
MSSNPPPGQGPGRVSDRIEDVIDRIQFEVQHAVKYMNDAVVPQVRSESIQALRKLGETLSNLADRMDKPKGPQAG